MHPGQQNSSTTPWSDEEIQLYINLRADMDKTFRIASKIGKAGLWEELSRRFDALGHERSHKELEAKLGQYKPSRQRKRRKLQANQQEQSENSNALEPDQHEQPQDQSVRNQGVEAARKKLLEETDLNAFFSEHNSWRAAIISLKQGRSEAMFGD